MPSQWMLIIHFHSFYFSLSTVHFFICTRPFHLFPKSARLHAVDMEYRSSRSRVVHRLSPQIGTDCGFCTAAAASSPPPPAPINFTGHLLFLFTHSQKHLEKRRYSLRAQTKGHFLWFVCVHKRFALLRQKSPRRQWCLKATRMIHSHTECRAVPLR